MEDANSKEFTGELSKILENELVNNSNYSVE